MKALSFIRDPREQSMSWHELFEEIAREVEFFMKTAAERIVQFGGIAKETLRTAAIHLFKKLIKIDSMSGLGFLINFQQRNRVSRKEVVCQSSRISILRTARQ